MDQDVINLAKAIRQRESGGNFNAVGDAGTSKGGYQWQPATWKEHSKKILGVDNAEMTPDNQNAVAYGMIKTWKDKGLNPAQIAAKWNSGSETGWENKIGTTTINGKKIAYNVPAYVKEVTDTYQSFKASATPKAPEKTAGQIADETSAEQYGATFPSKEGDTALTAGMKTLGNLPKSAFNFAKGAIDMLNPVSTVNKIKEIVSGTKEFAKESGGYGKAFGGIAKELPKAAYEGIVPEAGRALLKGDTETAQRAITNDPFGQIAPFVFAAKGGAKAADNIVTRRNMADFVEKPFGKDIPKPSTKFDTAFETGMSKTAGAVTKPAGYVFDKVAGGVSRGTTGAIAQATGLNKETPGQIIKNPEAFTRKSMAETDRASIGRQVQSELAKLAEDKAETGKSYQPIRANPNPIKVEPNFWDNTFKETTGLNIKKGQLVAETTSKIRDAGDVRALQKVYEFWKPKFKQGVMTADEYLNLRKDLADAAKFEKDLGKRKDVEFAAGQIRAKLNEAYRPQVEGLKLLDENMSAQIKEYKELAKGLVDKEGTITDAGMARIANLSKNKPNLAAQLERIVPGITEQVRNLQAIVDIERASGIKVGTYTKGAIVGGGLAFGGPIQAIINMVLTSPQLAVPILRQYGLLKNSAAVKAVMNALKEGGGKLNNAGATLSPYMQKDVKNLRLKAGMSIEDVSGKSGAFGPKKLSTNDTGQKATGRHNEGMVNIEKEAMAYASERLKKGDTENVVLNKLEDSYPELDQFARENAVYEATANSAPKPTLEIKTERGYKPAPSALQDLIDDFLDDNKGRDSQVVAKRAVNDILDDPRLKKWFDKEYKGNQFDLRQDIENYIFEREGFLEDATIAEGKQLGKTNFGR